MHRMYAFPEENITKLKCLLDEMIAMINAHLFSDCLNLFL